MFMHALKTEAGEIGFLEVTVSSRAKNFVNIGNWAIENWTEGSGNFPEEFEGASERKERKR